MKQAWIRLGLLAALVAPTIALAQSGGKAYKALGVKPQDILSSTVMNKQVVPGGKTQVVCIVTFLTGKEGKADAVNVRLGVFDEFGDGLVNVYVRDFGAEHDGYIAAGDLVMLDVDRDGVNEIIVSYDDFEDPLIQQRIGEVILFDGEKLVTGWTGLVEYDATKAARTVPEERRDRYIRNFDWSSTLRTRGATLFVKKTMIAVAGERLPEPRTVEETFTLRGEAEHW